MTTIITPKPPQGDSVPTSHSSIQTCGGFAFSGEGDMTTQDRQDAARHEAQRHERTSAERGPKWARKFVLAQDVIEPEHKHRENQRGY